MGENEQQDTITKWAVPAGFIGSAVRRVGDPLAGRETSVAVVTADEAAEHERQAVADAEQRVAVRLRDWLDVHPEFVKYEQEIIGVIAGEVVEPRRVTYVNVERGGEWLGKQKIPTHLKNADHAAQQAMLIILQAMKAPGGRVTRAAFYYEDEPPKALTDEQNAPPAGTPAQQGGEQ